MKVHSAQSPTYLVLMQLEETGIVPFSDTKTLFVDYYHNKLTPLLKDNILQDYTNHPTQGYFYFIYDSHKFTREKAIQAILNID